ncbi:DNA topoisomerase IB [Pseudoduganella ginsengisoli]|uniref:DNA topoisomerase n=1 Tax=Pseudoduganella ginsengisoli TaxID=1462440 RepID=A0A6L6PVZ5_9BURK|nr:DNA topoisomerase IB [Pseudoduganella ginsengisoli]MTW01396.1 DNA topoisomerase IB [Pseudoduganella ginsengisoli]
MKRERSAAILAMPAAAIDARAAGLRHVHDDRPGLRRIPTKGGFRYTGADGKPVRDAATLARIRALAIPPAWRDVWICPTPNGHLQATGRDARGRKQYRYHTQWRSVRDGVKYERMLAFGQALPAIRRHVDAALALPGLPREKVLATVVHLLQATMMRIGNEEYARNNHSFGLTTLRNRHVRIDGSKVRFRFRGKSGVQHDVTVSDRRVARNIRRLRELPGQELFQYADDDGTLHSIGSGDVNDYLRAISGDDYTAKDFRTWHGSVLAAQALLEYGPAASAAEAKKNIVRAIEAVARKLGNTPAVCRKCYVHPVVIDAYLSGATLALPPATAPDALAPEEHALLTLLQNPATAAIVAK